VSRVYPKGLFSPTLTSFSPCVKVMPAVVTPTMCTGVEDRARLQLRQ
jgi:hypothetical protein